MYLNGMYHNTGTTHNNFLLLSAPPVLWYDKWDLKRQPMTSSFRDCSHFTSRVVTRSLYVTVCISSQSGQVSLHDLSRPIQNLNGRVSETVMRSRRKLAVTAFFASLSQIQQSRCC